MYYVCLYKSTSANKHQTVPRHHTHWKHAQTHTRCLPLIPAIAQINQHNNKQIINNYDLKKLLA